MQSEPVRYVLHGGHSGDAVSEMIKGRAVEADAVRSLHRADEPSAHAALRGNADPDAEFAGEIIHPAGEHDALDRSHIPGGQPVLLRKRVDASVGQDDSEAGKRLCRDGQRAYPEVEIDGPVGIGLKDSLAFQEVGDGPVPVSRFALPPVDRFVQTDVRMYRMCQRSRIYTAGIKRCS